MAAPEKNPSQKLLQIKVPRRIEASPEEVFDAWADPLLFRRWFEPHRSIFRKAAVDELWLLGGGPCGPPLGALLPLPARRAPEAARVHLDVGGDARPRITRERRADAVARRHRPHADAQRAPRRRDGPGSRRGMEEHHGRARREDQGTPEMSPDRRCERFSRRVGATAVSGRASSSPTPPGVPRTAAST